MMNREKSDKPCFMSRFMPTKFKRHLNAYRDVRLEEDTKSTNFYAHET